jgi:hypothetical protein
MLKRGFLSILLAGLSLAATGCGSPDEEEEFSYGEAEMRGVAVGEFTGTMTMSGKTATSLDLTLTQAPPQSQPTCASRTFGLEPQCIATSSLVLTGTLTTGDGAHAGTALDGEFMVLGYTMTGGELSLHAGSMSLFIAWDGAAFHDGSVGGPEEGTFTLEKKQGN